VTITGDWAAFPPRLVWRQRVGPAWSSPILVGGLLFTQEQRGNREAVVAYDAASGREDWVHEDDGRFEEGVSGPGPRATPAFAGGRVYALGATGRLNCLDAATGRVIWARDAAADAGATAPQWGFSGSPLVTGNLVIMFAGGNQQKSLLAYRAESGDLAWTADAGTSVYGSPQPATLVGVPQILFFGDKGLAAFDPATGAVLWEHPTPAPGAPRSIQPHPLGADQVLVASEADLGLALVEVAHGGSTWSAERRWTSRDLKPAFNDFVVHDGHAYGFDGSIFTCVDLQTGKRRWKGGRYGHGQVVLLADPGLLLVVSETGEVVMLAADPKELRELGRFQAIEGKTWNHPVVARGRLYVRNGEEMACYELAPAAEGR
jgi:outer membrane protein assembly factor BamB